MGTTEFILMLCFKWTDNNYFTSSILLTALINSYLELLEISFICVIQIIFKCDGHLNIIRATTLNQYSIISELVCQGSVKHVESANNFCFLYCRYQCTTS